MSDNKGLLLIDEVLRNVARHFRVPATPTLTAQGGNPAALMAIAIEAARASIDQGGTPSHAVKQRFLEALAHMIHKAMHVNSGDPAFQAMVLEHHADQVREYASLSAQTKQDCRLVMATVNAVAHPAKMKRLYSSKHKEVLSRLHEAASTSSWTTLHATAQQLMESPEIEDDSSLIDGITRIRNGAALARLRRAEELESDQLVQQYRALRDQNGPRSGSDDAAAQGRKAKKRGAGVEALAAQALQCLADLLNRAEANTYRIATSLRVPSALLGDAVRSKAEWDVVLLRKAASGSADSPANKASDKSPEAEPTTMQQTHRSDSHVDTAALNSIEKTQFLKIPQNIAAASIWNICLLVEAKASADAATTDFPRLLRGLQLLAQADGATVYSFETQEGTVHLHGASLNALTTDETELKRTVLYCTDAPAETMPRLLNPASRMQLLSAPASLEFAGKLADRHIGIANKEASSPASDQTDNAADTQEKNPQADLKVLEPVWHELLESPRWRPVLHQYQTLRRVRELMVHPDDLISAIRPAENPP